MSNYYKVNASLFNFLKNFNNKAESPWQFLYYVLLILSPLFALSAFLSHQLIKELDKKEKDTKKTQKRIETIKKQGSNNKKKTN
jgi:hypothetical protein